MVLPSWEEDFKSLKISSPRTKQWETPTTLNQESDFIQPPEQQQEDPIQEKNTADESQRFVPREASLDEEYQRAANLRAEAFLEGQPDQQLNAGDKQIIAEQEYAGLKKRSEEQVGQKCICIIVEQKELESLVGTLDVYILKYIHGEDPPQEQVEVYIPPFVHKTDSTTYGYLANLCVAKSARRQGVAKTMLGFALKYAKDNGVDHVYVHVKRSNEPAQDLYKKLGFWIVEGASLKLLEEEIYLLCLELEA